MSVRRTLMLTALPLLAAAALSSAAALSPPTAAAQSGTTDYSDRSHWLHLPTTPVTRKVDVFYLYPTAYSKTSPSDPNFCAIDNPSMVRGAKVALKLQAAAFSPFANIYAPYYRQADGKWVLNLPLAEHEKAIKGIPTHDGIAAFNYYIRHYNHGRPFILAGHSQGSNVMIYLLSKYMKSHPKVYKRMIAAYVVGYSVTRKRLAANPILKFARGAKDTGVIVSWNTEAPTIAAPSPLILPGALAINPITWTRKQTRVSATQNLGSLQIDSTTGRPVTNSKGRYLRVLNLADARVDSTKGVIICSTVIAAVPPYLDQSGLFPEGVLHPWDYPFYFFNLRANAHERTRQYFSKQ